MAGIIDFGGASIPVAAGDDGTYRTSHDMSEGGLSVTITLALSEVISEEPEDLLSSFGEFVDPDALDQLFSTRAGEHRRGGPLYLTVADHEVTVFSDGEIHIRPVPTYG